MKYNASIISSKIKCKVRSKDLLQVEQVFNALPHLAQSMKDAEYQGALVVQELKDTAAAYVHDYGTAFSRYFIPKLPPIVRDDLEYQIAKRLKRSNASRDNIERFINATVKHYLKSAPFIEEKFPFADKRNNAPLSVGVHSGVRDSVEMDHDTLMSDDALERLAFNLVEQFTRIIQLNAFDDDNAGEQTYLDALKATYRQIGEVMRSVHIKPPQGKKKHNTIQEAERELEITIRRCLDVTYLIRKFVFLRNQYIEHAQISLGRVGKKKGQKHYVSTRSFSRWKRKQIEAKQWLDTMAVYNPETGFSFDLAEVVKRTTSNQENRRVELIVRTRGDEERAIDLGYEGVFITWTLPSKFHRNSHKWNGCTVKEAHENLMQQWQLARAWFKKPKINIDWFGLRVAEPHRDGTPHAHMFLYVHPSQRDDLIEICRSIAYSQDSDELKTAEAKKARFHAEICDPSKGTATGYIIKYISKNINGAHMPETDAEHNAERVNAWASTHRIRQFSQSGAKSVGIWRQLRRATKTQTEHDEMLESLRDACDKSRWKEFCSIAGVEKLAYEVKFNKYGETVKRVIGIEWLGQVIETCATNYALVTKKVAKQLLETRSVSPWSTENKCNSGLSEALMTLTGWSYQGVQCLIAPLLRGAKVPIDRYLSVSWRNNRLVTH
ncbi:replication endonuclease [Vibrio vulnificus]|uniref:replication endonuclease n=1 Tax=Vibrio vulnificus TaxID=672 RepID=UPI001F5E836F|nr:replication endonuclease [Vibrio vulnificus]